MTRLTIDQILQATTPARANAEPSNSAPAKGGQFQKHLQRASTLEEPARPPEPTENRTDEDENDLALATGEEQDTTQEHVEPTAPPVEGEDSLEPIPIEPEILVATDEITISNEALVAIVADETIVPGEINAETEVVSTEITQPVDLGGNPETDSESTPFSSDQIEELPDGTQAEEPLLNVGALEKTGTPATSATVTSEELQPDIQEPQPADLENSTTQNFANSTNQPLKSNDTALQPTRLHEVEPEITTPEATPETKERTTSEPLFQQETSLQETATLRAGTEPTQATSTTPAETNTAPAPIEASTTNESTLPLGKSAAAPAVETSSAASDARTEADSVPTTDRAKFVQRVSGALRAARDQNGLVQLKLSPPELGTLRIEITVKQGALTAQVETETAAARNILLDNLPALRERLAEQEIRIEKFNVDVRDEGNQQQENPGAENRRSGNNPSDKAPTQSESRSKEKNTQPDSPNIIRPTSNLSAQLDVMI